MFRRRYALVGGLSHAPPQPVTGSRVIRRCWTARGARRVWERFDRAYGSKCDGSWVECDHFWVTKR